MAIVRRAVTSFTVHVLYMIRTVNICRCSMPGRLVAAGISPIKYTHLIAHSHALYRRFTGARACARCRFVCVCPCVLFLNENIVNAIGRLRRCRREMWCVRGWWRPAPRTFFSFRLISSGGSGANAILSDLQHNLHTKTSTHTAISLQPKTRRLLRSHRAAFNRLNKTIFALHVRARIESLVELARARPFSQHYICRQRARFACACVHVAQ